MIELPEDPKELARFLLGWGVIPFHVAARTGISYTTAREWRDRVPRLYVSKDDKATKEQRLESAIKMVEIGVEKRLASKLTGCDHDALSRATEHIEGRGLVPKLKARRKRASRARFTPCGWDWADA